MNDFILPDSLAAVATLSLKDVNQDACAVINSQGRTARGVVICDGIGSHAGAEFAAKFAASSIAEQIEWIPLEMLAALDAQAMQGIYYHTCKEMGEKSESDPAVRAALTPGASPGCTALCAVELPRSILLAYCGNGAILHLRANFNDFPECALLPWSAIDMVNPHSHPVNGKNLLYKFLSAKASTMEAEPTVLMLSKDEKATGDIVAVVSDGIRSYDQAKTAISDDKEVWVHADGTLPMLYSSLNEFFRADEITQAALERVLVSYLAAVMNKGLMSDDCSIGVLITGKAIEYQRKRKVNHAQEACDENDHPSVLAEHGA